jgi:hypothetical protein
LGRLQHSPAVAAVRDRLHAGVLAGTVTAVAAADEMLAAFDRR